MLMVLILLSNVFILISMLGTILHKIMNSLNHSLTVERGCALERNPSYLFVNLNLSFSV